MSAEMIEKKCPDCGKMFLKKKKAYSTVRCPECQHKRNNFRKSTGVALKQTKYTPHECKKVGTCIYRGKAGSMPICNYLMIMGHKRPCGVQNCTVYKRGKSLSKEEE